MVRVNMDYHGENGHLRESNLQIQYIPIKIPTQLITGLDRALLLFIWINKKPSVLVRFSFTVKRHTNKAALL